LTVEFDRHVLPRFHADAGVDADGVEALSEIVDSLKKFNKEFI